MYPFVGYMNQYVPLIIKHADQCDCVCWMFALRLPCLCLFRMVRWHWPAAVQRLFSRCSHRWQDVTLFDSRRPCHAKGRQYITSPQYQTWYPGSAYQRL